METPTLLSSALGGVLIGLASAALLVLSGRVAGISGIAGGLLRPTAGDLGWRFAFLAGLLGGGIGMFLIRPEWFTFSLDRSPAALIAAGLLVGVGTQMGSGCTSGHGVCGLGCLSKRSLFATCTFMLTGGITVFLVRAVLGGAL